MIRFLMKKLLAALFSVWCILAFGDISEAMAISWTEVVSGNALSVQAPDLSIETTDHQYIIDGGGTTVIDGVSISTLAPETTLGDGTYLFRNITIDGDVIITSTDHHSVTLQLENTVILNGRIELNSGVDPYASNWQHVTEFSYGDITANIACDSQFIGLYPCFGSIIRLHNTGTTGGIHSEAFQNSHMELTNESPTGGLLIQMADQCTAEITSNSSSNSLICWLWNDSTMNFVNNASQIGLLHLGAEGGSHLSFVNNSYISNYFEDSDGNSWGDYQAMLGVDESSSITLTGTGSFAPGRQIYDYYTCDYTPKDYGASVVIRVEMPQSSSDHALNLQKVREIAGNVFIEASQLTQHPGADWVVAVRRCEDDPAYSYVVDIIGSSPDQPEVFMLLPENLETIDASAFEGCTGAEAIVIPESVRFIGDDAFKNCPNAVLIVVPGSYAHEYALEHGMTFIFSCTN